MDKKDPWITYEESAMISSEMWEGLCDSSGIIDQQWIGEIIKGKISDVRIWDRALTAYEIKELYKQDSA